MLNHGVQFFGENRWDGLTAGLLAQGNGPPERLQAGATCHAFGDVGFDFPSLGLIHLPVDVFREPVEKLQAMRVVVGVKDHG